MPNQTDTLDVCIIGAGVSGLTSAWLLQKNGKTISILEKENRTGGAIHSEMRNNFLIEYGPNSTLDTHPEIHTLFKDLKIESEMEYANDRSKNRYIIRNGQLRALPMSPPAFFMTNLFTWSAKFRLFREPFIKPTPPEVEETLAEFVLRRLGKDFLNYAIDPFVAGVYAGLPEKLSVKAAFPKLHALEQKYGSLIKGTIQGARERKKRQEVSKQEAKLFSFPNGMQTLTDTLTKQLDGKIQTGTSIETVKKNSDSTWTVTFSRSGKSASITARHLLFAIPAHALKKIRFEPELSFGKMLDQIYYPPVSMVFLGWDKQVANRPLDGFGYLVPRVEKMNILGTIWSSTIFNNRAPEGGTALTTFVGGSRQPDIALKDEDELIHMVQSDLKTLMGIEQKPGEVVVRQWKQAIPQYNIGHLNIMDKISEFESAHPGIHFSGNFRGGISVGDCIKQAFTMTETINKLF